MKPRKRLGRYGADHPRAKGFVRSSPDEHGSNQMRWLHEGAPEEPKPKRKVPRATCAATPFGSRTELYRVLAWYMGDVHASRLCRFLDLYCWFVGRSPSAFYYPFPR